jgi:hypothetical protein
MAPVAVAAALAPGGPRDLRNALNPLQKILLEYMLCARIPRRGERGAAAR